MSASMCASPASLLAPDTPCRSRYRDACSGFTANTVYPAAASAATHGPRSVSIPTTTSASPASSPRCCPISSCSWAIPATPSGSRRFASTLPGLRPSAPRRDGPQPSHPLRTAASSSPVQDVEYWSAACGRTISDLMKLCSRQQAGTTSQQRSALPVTGRGTIFRQGSKPRMTQVLTCRRLPGTESAVWRPVTLIRITGAVGGAGAAPRSDHRHPGCVLRGNGRVGAPGLSAPAWPRVMHAHFGSPRRRRRTPMSTTGSAPVRQRGRPDRRLHHRPGEPSGRMGQPRAVHVPRGHRARQGHRPRRGTADCRAEADPLRVTC